jgi:hypothetical protein
MAAAIISSFDTRIPIRVETATIVPSAISAFNSRNEIPNRSAAVMYVTLGRGVRKIRRMEMRVSLSMTTLLRLVEHDKFPQPDCQEERRI